MAVALTQNKCFHFSAEYKECYLYYLNALICFYEFIIT